MWCYLSGSQVHVCFNTISFTVTCFPTRLRSTVILWIHNAWKTQEKTSKLLIYWKIPATAQLVVSRCLLDTLRFGNSEHLCRVFENTAASQHDDLKARKFYDGLKSLRLSRFSLWEVCGRQREPIPAPRQCTWLTIASKAAFGSKVNDDVVGIYFWCWIWWDCWGERKSFESDVMTGMLGTCEPVESKFFG